MKIHIVTPAPSGSRKGNRITADRWGRLFADMGHEVCILDTYEGTPCDVLIALHAYRSHASIRRFRAEHPEAPLVVILTGTDVYGHIHQFEEARQSLEMATRLVGLQPLAVRQLAGHLHPKYRTIFQSVEVPAFEVSPREDVFEVCVMGHLRPVKDPFRTALAARLLPESSRIRVLHLGGALSAEMAHQAERERERNPRYEWLGELPREGALEILARCRLLSLTSELEGGANVISEALAVGVPVISSRIDGSVGMLGEEYPGYFPYGDEQALAELLHRAESEPDFLATLRRRCEARRWITEPDEEIRRWKDLLKELRAGERGTSVP